MSEIYGYSFNEESYHGRYSTRDEALAAAKAEHAWDRADTGHCWTCRGVDVKPENYLLSGYDFIEGIEVDISDNHANEDPIFNVSKEQRADLERRLQVMFVEWMQAHPTAWRQYYEAADVQEHNWAFGEPPSVDAVDPVGGRVTE